MHTPITHSMFRKRKKYKYNKIYDIIKLRNKKMFPDSP